MKETHKNLRKIMKSASLLVYISGHMLIHLFYMVKIFL